MELGPVPFRRTANLNNGVHAMPSFAASIECRFAVRSRRPAGRLGRAAWACALLPVGLLGHSAAGATVSLKAFDRLAQQIDVAYLQSGTDDIHRRPMERTAFGIWRAGFSVPAGDYEYRFVADGEWFSDVGNPEFQRWDDGSIWSRFSVPGADDAFANYRPAAAPPPAAPVREPAADAPPAPPELADGQIAVTFKFHAPLVEEAAVVGTFNDWNGEKNPMFRRAGFWECTLPLAPGTYEYKFKIGSGWYADPDQPPQTPGGNSVLAVKSPPPESPSGPLVHPDHWQDAAWLLLEPATGLHAFQQELLRAYVYVLGSDRGRLKIADGSLLNPDLLPGNPPARWGWSIDSSAGRPKMVLTVGSNAAAFELKHPLLDPPRDWLAEYRRHAQRIFPDAALDLSGPTSPPPGSAWAAARAESENRRPFADVYAVNRMTDFGRQNGWSAELLREIATIYADLAVDGRHPGLGGWAPLVFAARAVVYADLARNDPAADETMAYVLARIGRPGDGAAFLPAHPETLAGHLAAARAGGDPNQLLKWAGSPDHYGLDARAGHPAHAPDMADFTAAQQTKILSFLSDLLDQDGQENLSRAYLDGALKRSPNDFAARVRALQRGGVGAGHRHAEATLRLAGNAALWRSVLAGDPPDCGEDRGARSMCRPAGMDSIAEQIADVSALYRDKQREVLDAASEAVPPAARLLLLRDLLNLAWWQNARFYGCSLYSESGCQRLNQVMATWKPFQPEMEAFTRFLMKSPLKDHDYGAIRRGFTGRQRKPDTLDYVRLVRRAFGTWLMDEAQRMYPLVPTLQSDLLADYETGQDVFDFQGQDHLRANVRRLAPLHPAGYPAPGPRPAPDDPAGIPERLFRNSYALNQRLAQDWARTFTQESQDAAIAFHQRSRAIAPYEIEAFRDGADLLMDNGRYAEALALAESCPDTMEALEQAAMKRIGAFAALEIGAPARALALARAAAATGQSASMSVYAYVLEITGDLEQALAVSRARDARYGKEREIYLLARQLPEQAEEMAPKIFDWIEQFPDLEQARKDNRFSFNALKNHPYMYAALDRWDRALWLLKPLAEAVQNDFIWFGLMAVGQKTGDSAAVELGQHVLATHVFNVWGDFARFMRRQTTWEEVLAAARIEDKPQPMYCLAAILAEQRGDAVLAARLYKQTLDPRYATGPWFTIAWRALRRLGHDPLAFARRTFPATPPPPDPATPDEHLADDGDGAPPSAAPASAESP